MSLKDYFRPNPKTVEGQVMKWSDYFLLGGGWLGWVFLYWLLFVYRFINEECFVIPFSKQYLCFLFLLLGLVLTYSAFHYRKNWNDKFQKIKQLWMRHYMGRQEEINCIYGKLKFLCEKHESNGEWDKESWSKLLKDFDKHITTVRNIEEIKRLKGDSDYNDQT